MLHWTVCIHFLFLYEASLYYSVLFFIASLFIFCLFIYQFSDWLICYFEYSFVHYSWRIQNKIWMNWNELLLRMNFFIIFSPPLTVCLIFYPLFPSSFLSFPLLSIFCLLRFVVLSVFYRIPSTAVFSTPFYFITFYCILLLSSPHTILWLSILDVSSRIEAYQNRIGIE